MSEKQNNSGSFIFGLVLGAVIGAVIAVIIYKNNKNKVLKDLQTRLQDFFNRLIESKKINLSKPPTPKKPVVIPANIPAINIEYTPKKSKPRKFKR